MNKKSLITIDKFEEAFTKIGWHKEASKSGRYTIWVDPSDRRMWTRVPTDVEASDYGIYQDKNILILLDALAIEESQNSKHDLLSQLENANYKIINRIITKDQYSNDSVPYELAQVLSSKNIDAFRYFYHTKSGKSSIALDKFQMNHTQVGSFVIPISVLVDDDGKVPLMPMQSKTNIILHDYLKTLNNIVKLPTNSVVSFAEKALADSIDSKLVRDFFARNDSVAKIKSKYEERIESLSVTSHGSPFLDFGLKIEERKFDEVDLGSLKVLDDEYVQTLERLEVKADNTKINAYNASISVIVEQLNVKGRVRFTVTEIDGEKMKNPFKADSAELPKTALDQFAELFKNEGKAIVRGDISKSRGKLGRVIVSKIGSDADPNLTFKL